MVARLDVGLRANHQCIASMVQDATSSFTLALIRRFMTIIASRDVRLGEGNEDEEAAGGYEEEKKKEKMKQKQQKKEKKKMK